MTKITPEDMEKITLPDPTTSSLSLEGEGQEGAHTSAPATTLSATVGTPLPPNTPKATKDDIIAALKSVQDPELMLNIYELGLIYDIAQEENGDVKVLMTLTSPMCPVAGEMPRMAATAVSSVPGVGQVTVTLTFDPPWTLDKLSDEIKLLMGV